MPGPGRSTDDAGTAARTRNSQPATDLLLEHASIVVAYSELLAHHATELTPMHRQILAAIHSTAERLRSELLAVRPSL
ncbi:MAG: hypothetical protein KatS3mg060_2812 [Dehalococcoidia bacterium]|jgi:short-subunit dehydrogenase involved in D-alanine esterification of teichoic acids|nr:MAG: hypothetical protein KatS3mg060_2812 [Dehalococcoidia bacterium]